MSQNDLEFSDLSKLEQKRAKRDICNMLSLKFESIDGDKLNLSIKDGFVAIKAFDLYKYVLEYERFDNALANDISRYLIATADWELDEKKSSDRGFANLLFELQKPPSKIFLTTFEIQQLILVNPSPKLDKAKVNIVRNYIKVIEVYEQTHSLGLLGKYANNNKCTTSKGYIAGGKETPWIAQRQMKKDMLKDLTDLMKDLGVSNDRLYITVNSEVKKAFVVPLGKSSFDELTEKELYSIQEVLTNFFLRLENNQLDIPFHDLENGKEVYYLFKKFLIDKGLRPADNRFMKKYLAILESKGIAIK